MSQTIRLLTSVDLPGFNDHFARHRAESGSIDPYFMPFAADDPQGPRGLDSKALTYPLNKLGWQRWWLAVSSTGQIIGHVNLKGAALRSMLHRCELGIGIEHPYRGGGLGRKLMQTAISFTQNVDSLCWIDLRVFAHNTAARALYQSLGFVELGRIQDCFRIDKQSISDVIMVLQVGA